MARRSTSSNGHDRLETALVQAQAALTQNEGMFLGRLADSERRHLIEHLTDAIREKIGFKG